jgi:HEAT repeat protein
MIVCAPESTDIALESLCRVLASDDSGVVLVALSLLQAMRASAESAIPAVLPLLSHPDHRVQRAAITALSFVASRVPQKVMPAFLRSDLAHEHLEALLHAFIAIGPAAHAAIPLATQATQHARGKVRGLALRALDALQAPVPTLVSNVRIARFDRHASVRAIARQLAARLVVATKS